METEWEVFNTLLSFSLFNYFVKNAEKNTTETSWRKEVDLLFLMPRDELQPVREGAGEEDCQLHEEWGLGGEN